MALILTYFCAKHDEMMPGQFVFIVVMTAVTGFFIGWLSIRLLFSPKIAMAPFGLQGVFPYLLEHYAADAASYLKGQFFTSGRPVEKLNDPLLYEKLKPEIENHVDFFLKEKLSAVFPLLYKFMGEKTLGQFKHAFLAEIDLLFPEIMNKYAGELFNNMDIENMISTKLAAINPATLQQNMMSKFNKQIRFYIICCGVIGAIMGVFIATTVALLRF